VALKAHFLERLFHVALGCVLAQAKNLIQLVGFVELARLAHAKKKKTPSIHQVNSANQRKPTPRTCAHVGSLFLSLDLVFAASVAPRTRARRRAARTTRRIANDVCDVDEVAKHGKTLADKNTCNFQPAA
jgi:hypothetical protein